MSSPSVPVHGKTAAIYRMRPNGFKGDGLNDASWGTGYNGVASAYFEVVIQTEGTPDQFKWRKDGGAWTENVAITGAAQTLSDGQTITFAATTGHTANDQWVIGNLKDEACTESGVEAQITDSAKLLLNANAVPIFTDSGGKNVIEKQLVLGKAIFDGNVTTVTVTGNNGYIVRSALELVAYSFDWHFTAGVDLAVIPRHQKQWKEKLPGQAEASGGAESYFIGGSSFFDALKEAAEGGDKYFLLELYTYEPDGDQTGDHFAVWAAIKGADINAPVNEVMKEPITFEFHGIPKFVANT